jgi:hypothetical protein
MNPPVKATRESIHIIINFLNANQPIVPPVDRGNFRLNAGPSAVHRKIVSGRRGGCLGYDSTGRIEGASCRFWIEIQIEIVIRVGGGEFDFDTGFNFDIVTCDSPERPGVEYG